MKHKKVIISGGPGFGKTSIIDELEKRNFLCMHEISRSIIKEQIICGGDILPWKNLQLFSEQLLEKRINQYNIATNDQWVFFDRGMPDILAYMDRHELKIPESYATKIQLCAYFPLVFIVPPWPEIYRNDNERREDYKTASEMHDYIVSSYKKLGYQIIELPKISVFERTNFILKCLDLVQVLNN